jgi:hypothetical protein
MAQLDACVKKAEIPCAGVSAWSCFLLRTYFFSSVSPP